MGTDIGNRAAHALLTHKPFNRGNTRCNGVQIFLHGHPIITTTNENGKVSLYVTLCGFQTRTTYSRINDVLAHFSVPNRIIIRKQVAYFYNLNDASTLRVDPSQDYLVCIINKDKTYEYPLLVKPPKTVEVTYSLDL